jgi:hypothetical protein
MLVGSITCSSWQPKWNCTAQKWNCTALPNVGTESRDIEMGANSATHEARRTEADSLWQHQKDAIRKEAAIQHQGVLDKIARLRSLRLAKNMSQYLPTEKPEQYRKRADRCTVLAQHAQGDRRSELLNLADQWDVLAETSEELALRAKASAIEDRLPT